MFNFTQIANCRASEVEQPDYDNPHKLRSHLKGDLQVYVQMTTGLLLFRLSSWQYGVNPNDRVVYDMKNQHFKLILCFVSQSNQCYVLKLNDDAELVYFVLSERCKLIQKTASRIMVRQIQEAQRNVHIQSTPPLVKANNQIADDDSTTSLIEASKSLSKGLAYAGKLVAQGLQFLGGFIAKKVKPEEAIVVSQDTKRLIKHSVEGSNKVLQVTTESFAAIFRMAKNEALKLLEKAENAHQAQSKSLYKDIKKKVLTGLHIIANVYDGASQGISHAGDGLAKGTNEVVKAKYGQDAHFVSQNAIQGIRNVYNITEAPYKTAKQEFKPTEAMIKKL